VNRLELRVDHELIERCIKGDEVAWKDLVHRYQRLVYSIAHTICANPDDSSDVFQQVWLELYQHLADLRNIEALPAWLMTVTRRRCYGILNAKRGIEPLDEEMPDLSQKLSQIEREHALEQALEQLPERCRQLLDLLYFNLEEPSYAEIADKMSMPVASIGPTRARCLEKLRKLLA
jgi:RNA polymerase sigma factor (sigma-70 family)